MDLIETGKIVNTHGIRGELKIQPWADDPEDLLSFDVFYIDKTAYTVVSSRLHKGMILVHFDGVQTLEAAEKLKNKIVFADASLFELEEGEYFQRDLIGLQVYDSQTGEYYGELTDIFQTGANDVYEISSGEKKEEKKLIPAIKDCIKSVDLSSGEMKISPLEGLFD